MKTFRFLIVAVFLLGSVVTNTVHASGQSVGFVRLLARVDSGLPIQIQSRQAFERMRPALLALQNRGAILEFEPELEAGIVKIKYGPNRADRSVFEGYQLYDNIHDSITSAMHKQHPTALTPSASSSVAAFYLELYDSCFGAYNLGADSHVIGSLRDKTGRIVASYEGNADSTGAISMDCFPWIGSFSDIVPGYTLTFNVYDTTPVLLGTYSVVAPAIKFTTIKSATAVVRGTGPARKTYHVSWYHRNWNALNDWSVSAMTGITSPAGAWAEDMSSLTFRGGDGLDFFMDQSSNFTFDRFMSVPYIYCQLGSNFCDISGFAFQPATLSVVQRGKTYAFSGKFDAFGHFSAILTKAGNPIFLKAGDGVSGTKVPAYKLPVLTAAVDFSTNVVSGKVPPNRYIDLWAYTLCTCNSYLVYSHSNAAGTYAGDFSGLIDLDPAQATNVEVYYVDRRTGNTTDYYRSYSP